MMHSVEGHKSVPLSLVYFFFLVMVLSGLVWRSPKDRVLLFQSIAVSFFVLILVLHSVGQELEWLDPVLMIFVFFLLCWPGTTGC
jgi:hypothetical protein